MHYIALGNRRQKELVYTSVLLPWNPIMLMRIPAFIVSSFQLSQPVHQLGSFGVHHRESEQTGLKLISFKFIREWCTFFFGINTEYQLK